MKIFHLSDLHIGLKLMNRDLVEDQKHIFSQIANYAKKEQPDAILIAGDIYDKAVPSADAVDLFDYFTMELSEAAPEATIMMISGNHDSAPRVNVYRNLLKKQKLYMIGQPPRREEEYMEKVTLQDHFGDVNFYLLPFVKPSMVKNIVGTDEKGNNLSYNESVRRLIERENVDSSLRNVLVSHQFYLPVGKDADQVERMDSEIKAVGNVDEVRGDILNIFDYAALGHIHKPMLVGDEKYRYCGTPLACSISEAGQEKGVVMVELEEKGHETITVLPLKPLREVRIVKGELKELLEQASDDYVRVVLTDKKDLDVFDMQDRIRLAFPNYLEIMREAERVLSYDQEIILEKEMDPFELCKAFLGQMSEEEETLLQDVFNTVKGGF